MADLLKPKPVTVTSLDGEEKVFTISRLDCWEQREVAAKYVPSGLPKVGDYATNEAMVQKMMAYVAVGDDPQGQRLTTRALVKNHVDDWEMLFQLEKAMLSYNTSFFSKGTTLDFFGNLKQTAKAFLIETLTDLLAVSSKAAKPPFKS